MTGKNFCDSRKLGFPTRPSINEEFLTVKNDRDRL
jgi:hypothetical protein